MNSRPGPGVHESLQNRGGPAPPRTQMWRQLPKPISSLHNSFNNSLPNAPPSDCIDPNLEAERQSVEESVAAKSRTPGTVRNKPTALEGIHTATSDVARPLPRGKPQLFFRNQTGSSSSSEPPTLPPLSQVLTLLPLPPRPGFVHPAEISGRTIPGGTGVKDDASAKWQAAEVTPPAAVLPGGGTADLSPWTGSQPEDTLSEALVKGGISNKPQIMNETNTARPSVWSNLKNKSGISTLSTVFVTVMDKKQSTGRLTTPNTFKPPPRLTLRDSTREQWLHDLANPAIPLRRLSRTIPHGLTGKVLLEQCLKKDIPLLRAVWLAQCVGTNELRAHKRKGQAGTVSWTRGWTISVEQFVDSVLGTIGQQDWKPRTTYALQLATHLYKEHLLDEDHFIDWLLKHLESCPFERLFVWLLMVGIGHYWQTLTSTRRLGKRLADALLCHTEKLRRLEEQGFTSDLSEYLENALIKLLAAEPACLLLPKTWETHGPLLRIITKKSEQPQAIQSFERLNERVQRLLRPSKSAPSSPQTSAGRIYHMLDSVNYSGSVRMEDLAFDCIKVMSDFRELIPTVLQWACSVHREGTHRIYLATRLLRRWSHADADVYDGVMSYLGRINTHEKGEQGEPRAIFRIIAELVRSRTFSIGRYLQWLIATGSLSQHQDLSLPSAWPLRLLTEIPLHGLPEQVKTLRYTLLRGSIYSIDMEERTFHDVKDAIRQRLPFVFDLFNMDANENELYTEKLSRTVRLEIGNWLRQQVAENMEMVERVPTKDPSIEESTKVSKITLSEFNIVRFFLERFDDLSMLADVINIVVTSLDPSVLASAADTLHYNHKAFRAIGAFDSLFQGIAMRYAALRTIRFPDRDLLLSLSDLSRTAGSSDDQLKQVLGYDVSRLEQRNSFAACSPVSDNMDVMQGTGYDNDDEIERILSSGTTMDQQMMARVFGKIIYNLEEQVAKGHIQSENHSTWFYRLRSFSETTFDLVLEEWLNSTLMGHRVQLLQAALPPLVGSGCMSLTKFQELGKSSVTRHKQSQPEEAFHIAIDTLKNLLPSRHLSTHCQPQDAYRYRLEQEKVCFEPDSKILESVRDVIELGSIQSSRKAKEEMSSLIRNDTFSMILKHHVISDPKSLWTANIVGHQNSEPISSCTKSLLDALLDPLDHMQLSQKTLEQQVLVIFEHVNELSLPFCQLLIHQILLMSTTLDGASAESISVALLGAVKVAVEKDQPLWSSLITGLESDISSKIREHAERELLSGSAFLTSPSRRETAQGSQDVSAFINRYLSVIDFTSAATHKDKQPYVLVALIERFRGLTEALSASKDISKRPGQPQCKVSVPVLSLWLKALLRIAVEHGSGLLQEATYPQQTALMWSMRSLLNHSAFETSPQMVDYIYDVTVSLSDSVADEVRTRVARLDGVKQVDNPRCSFIFGNVAPVDGWLNVTIPIELPLRPAVSQTQIQGSSQSQTLGQGHSSPSSPILHSQRSFGQLSSSSPTVPSQRSFGQQQQSSQQQQMQLQGRSFSQHSQQSQSGRAASPLQRMPSNFGQSTPSQFQQQQQMQPTQNFSQQRVNQSSGPAPQPQRVPSVSMQGAGTASKAGASRHDKPEVKHYPFILPRWETLPDSGSTSTGNDTAISLTLFGARKV